MQESHTGGYARAASGCPLPNRSLSNNMGVAVAQAPNDGEARCRPPLDTLEEAALSAREAARLDALRKACPAFFGRLHELEWLHRRREL